MVSQDELTAAKAVINTFFEEQFPGDKFVRAIDSEHGRQEEREYYKNVYFAILRNKLNELFEDNVMYKVNLINRYYGYEVKEGVEYLIIGLFICDREVVQMKLYKSRIVVVEKDTSIREFRDFEGFSSYVTNRLIPKLRREVELKIKKGGNFNDEMLRKIGLNIDNVDLAGVTEDAVKDSITAFLEETDVTATVEDVRKGGDANSSVFTFNLIADGDVAYRGNNISISKKGVVGGKLHPYYEDFGITNKLVEKIEKIVKKPQGGAEGIAAVLNND